MYYNEVDRGGDSRPGRSAGIFNGKGSDPHTREAIEPGDCLLSIGYRPIDGTSGDFTASLPADTICARGQRWISARRATRR